MPKAPSERLFKLIKTLKPSEKRYFRLAASQKKADSKYLQLFEAIDKQDFSFDDALRMEIYPDQKIESKKFSELKSYLYDFILKVLQTYDEKSSVESRLKNMLQSVRVLFKRSHYDDCKDLLKKIKKLAHKYEEFSTVLENFRWEKKIAYTQENFSFLNKDLDRIDSEEQVYIEKIKNLSNFRNLFLTINFLDKKYTYSQKKINLEKIKLLAESSLLLTNIENAASFKAMILFYHSKIIYYSATLEYDKMDQSCKAALHLMESQFFMLKEDVSEYISILNKHIIVCGHLKKYDDVVNNLEKFQKIRPLTQDDEQKIFRQYYLLKFNYCLSTGALEEGVASLKAHFKEVKLLNKKSFDKSIFYFYYFYLYFGVKAYHKALKYLVKWINSPKNIDRPDLQCLSRMLGLIVHFEIGNTNLLSNLLHSSLHLNNNNQTSFTSEKEVVSFFKKMLKKPTEKEKKLALETLQTNLAVLSKRNSDRIFFDYFNFNAWIESKLQSTSFTNAIRSNMPNSLKLEILNT